VRAAAATETSLGWDQREAAAEHLLRLARLDGVVAPPLRAIVAALGWELSSGVARGAHGWIVPETQTIHIDTQGAREVVTARIAHELGHLAAMFACVAHDESDADAIGLALAVPRRWVRHAVRETGWDAPRIAARYPDATPLDAVTRAAVIAGGAAVVYIAGHRSIAVIGERGDIPLLPGERELVRTLRGASKPRPVFDADTGLHGWPMPGPYGTAVVLLASPEAAASW
jgi:hypothetical protein